jgi:hypothetical protein
MYVVPMKLNLDWQLLDDPEKLQSTHAVVHFYPQLTMLRKILQENLQSERDARDKRCNVHAKPHSFKVGDKVYLKVEYVSIGDKKHSRQFLGPYVILQLKGANLCRLQHLITGKLLSHFTNVDKIRPVKDNTAILRQRLQPSDVTVIDQMDAPLDLRISPTAVERNENMQTKQRDDTNSLTHLSPSADLMTSIDSDKILKISRCRPGVPEATYRVHFKNNPQSKWLLASQLPENLIIQFFLERHQKRLSRP